MECDYNAILIFFVQPSIRSSKVPNEPCALQLSPQPFLYNRMSESGHSWPIIFPLDEDSSETRTVQMIFEDDCGLTSCHSSKTKVIFDQIINSWWFDYVQTFIVKLMICLKIDNLLCPDFYHQFDNKSLDITSCHFKVSVTLGSWLKSVGCPGPRNR